MVVTNPNMVAPIAKTQTNENQTNTGVSPALTSETAKQSNTTATPQATPTKASAATAPTTTEQKQPVAPTTDTGTNAQSQPVIKQTESVTSTQDTPSDTPSAKAPVENADAPVKTETTNSITSTNASTPVKKGVVSDSITAKKSAPVTTENTESSVSTPTAKENAQIVATSQTNDSVTTTPTEKTLGNNGGLTTNASENTEDPITNVGNYAARNSVQALNMQGSQLAAAKDQRDRNNSFLTLADTTTSTQPIHVTVNYTNGGKTIASVPETIQGGQQLDIQGNMPSGYQVSGPFSVGNVTDGDTVNVPVVPVSSNTQTTMHVTVDYDYDGKTVASVPMTIDSGSTIDVAGHLPAGYQSAGTWNADNIKDGDTLHVPVVPTNNSNTNNSDTSNSGSSTTDNSGNSSSNTTPSNGSSDSSSDNSGSSSTPSTPSGTDNSSSTPAGNTTDGSGNNSQGSSTTTPDGSTTSGSNNNAGNSSSTPTTDDNNSSQGFDNSSSTGNGSQSSSNNSSQNGSQNSTPANGNSSSNDNSQTTTDNNDIPLTINWVDKTTGKTIGSTQVDLKPGSTNDITSLCPKGYRIDGSWNQENITKDTKTADVPVVPLTDDSSSSNDQTTDQTNSTDDKKGINIDVSADANAEAQADANANVNANTDDQADGQGAAESNAGTDSCGMALCDDGLGAVVEADNAVPEQLGAVIESAPAEETTSIEGQGSVLVPETVSMPATGQKSGSIMGKLIAGIAALLGFSHLMKRKAAK